jgi:H+/Cl- antiporter ClcA
VNWIQQTLKTLNTSQLRLYLLATISGLVAGIVIVLFRLSIDFSQTTLLPSHEIDGFSGLSWEWILALPIIGSLLISLLFKGLKPEQRSVGVVHVIERLAYHEGRMPWTNAVRQFLGGIIALVTGHSVGREAPSVHLGAATASTLGMSFRRPNNEIRILVAAGTASAIAASFNTPIAGVIFAMEVIMMEYYIASFIPIILASVSGVVVSRLAFGDETFFNLINSQMRSFWEIPYIIFLGISIGLIATLFIKSLQFFSTLFSSRPHWQRNLTAGIFVGLGGLVLPEVMGLSYELTNEIALGNVALSTLLMLVILKLTLSTACIGLGIPGGMIGPSIVVGAAAGAALGMVGHYLVPDHSSSIGLYAMIGMCAMMGATFKAPLAALMALLELTANPHIILPGMLAIVFASIVASDVFKFDSVFLLLLRSRGLDYRNDPITQTLRRISIADAMQREFAILPRDVSINACKQALSANPKWIIIEHENQMISLLPTTDLVRAVTESEKNESNQTINLLEIPASRKDLCKAPLHSSLQEALNTLNSNDAEALYITREISSINQRVYGVLTRSAIESYFRPIKK